MNVEKRGIGFAKAYSLGKTVSLIYLGITNLIDGTKNKFIIKDIIDNYDYVFAKDKLKKYNNNEEELNYIKDESSKLNKSIKDTNNLLESFGFKKTIELFDSEKFLELGKEKMLIDMTKKDILLVYENLEFKQKELISPILNSISEITNLLISNEKFEDIEKTNITYREKILEAINIYSIGYGKTAVLCIGRIIEDLINRILDNLKKNNQIHFEEYNRKKNAKYIDKIGFLKQGYLNDEEFTKLKSYSLDRNKGGHLNLGEIPKNRAKTLIQQGIYLIIDLEVKLKNEK